MPDGWNHINIIHAFRQLFAHSRSVARLPTQLNMSQVVSLDKKKGVPGIGSAPLRHIVCGTW